MKFWTYLIRKESSDHILWFQQRIRQGKYEDAKTGNNEVRVLANKLVESYVSQIKLTTSRMGELSNEEGIWCGIHPGYIIGPILLIIFTNYLTQCQKLTKVYQYDDGTTK